MALAAPDSPALPPPPAPPTGRILWIDAARGIALVAMAIYHFTWDLEFFGYLDPGLTAVGGWKLFARGIASSFLILVGVSLFLSHRNGVRWPPFWRRFAMIVGAALIVSAASYAATPGSFIFFGILHQIALASVVGLLFLRLPPLLMLVAAAAVIAAPYWLTSQSFDAPWWWWSGLSETRPRSNDYVPAFPWFGAVLIGMAIAGLAARAGVLDRLRALTPGRWSTPLQFAGRHSLAVYLIHQPVLIACVWLFAQLAPPVPDPPQVQFKRSCETSCATQREVAFCVPYCACVLDTLEAEGRLDDVFSANPDAAFRARLQGVAEICTADVDAREMTEPSP